MQRYTVYFIWKLLYMFRVVPSPIIWSANNCIYSIWYLSHRYSYLPLSWKSWNWFEWPLWATTGPVTVLLYVYIYIYTDFWNMTLVNLYKITRPRIPGTISFTFCIRLIRNKIHSTKFITNSQHKILSKSVQNSDSRKYTGKNWETGSRSELCVMSSFYGLSKGLT